MSASARPRSRCAPPSSPPCPAPRSPSSCPPPCSPASTPAPSPPASPACRSASRQLSRMVTAKEAAETKRGLADGSHQHRRRHPRPARQGHRVRRSRPADRRRGAAFRRLAQGEAEGAQGRRPRADPDRDADPAHPAARADRRARDEPDRHAAGRPPGRAHLHLRRSTAWSSARRSSASASAAARCSASCPASRTWTAWPTACARSSPKPA